MKKITSRTLKTRPWLITVLNTFTKEEIDVVMDHIEYIMKETVANTIRELSDSKSISKNKH